jgi:hypothetical protein
MQDGRAIRKIGTTMRECAFNDCYQDASKFLISCEGTIHRRTRNRLNFIKGRRNSYGVVPGSSAVEQTVVSRSVDGSNPFPGSHSRGSFN